MVKKIIKVLIFVILIGINGYLIYDLNEVSKRIKDMKEDISKMSIHGEEYLSLYQELEKEIGDVSQIEDKIGLLKREYQQNEEGLLLSAEDLENIKKKNSEVEARIIQLENEKREMEAKKLYSSFPTYSQFPNYPTGCESVSLYLLLWYYQVDVSVDDIVLKLKKGDLPYENNGKVLGGNPEVEFIGDPRTNYSYGVYNRPIQEVAEQFKSGVISKVNFDFSEVLKLVLQKHPVMVWTTINLSKPFISQTWTYPKTSETIKWISGEHAMVIFGVDQDKVIVSDPYTGTIRNFSKEIFEQRYNYLGKRAIYYE